MLIECKVTSGWRDRGAERASTDAKIGLRKWDFAAVVSSLQRRI